MMKKLAATLLCTVAPVAGFAQSVDLRSADKFINVSGEIIGYDGVVLQLETSIGAVSIPAADVICYGISCLEVVTNNAFGLTLDSFQGVVTAVTQEQGAASGERFVSFDAPQLRSLYQTLSGAYAVTNETASIVALAASGQLSLQTEATAEPTTLTVSENSSVVDIRLKTVPLTGAAPVAYAGATDWAITTQPTHQLVGLKAFSVIVSPTAGVTEISLSDLASIYAGEITNWSQIGGANMGILPLQLPPNSPVRAEIIKLVMEPAGKTIAASVLTMADEASISASINQFPGSISIVDTALADASLTVDVAGTCGVAVGPTNFSIVSGDYPLARPIMATFNTRPNNRLVAELFDFASTDVVQRLVEREGYLSHDARLQDLAVKNARLSGLLTASFDDAQRAAAAAMFQGLFGANRLSLTLTGGIASGPEGAWNRAMLLDLVEELQDRDNNGREIIFVGFGESTAGSAAAISASAAAAASMETALREIAGNVVASGGYTVSSFGFGNVSPTTCYDGQISGPDHTRVEVWIR